MDNGAKIRAFHILKALARKHRVTILSFYGAEAERRHFHVYESLGVKLVPILKPAIDRSVGPKDLLRSLLTSLPLTVSKYHDARMAEEISRHLGEIDALHCEHMHMAQYLFGIDNLPKVLDAHNVESQIAERIAASEKNPLKKLLLRWNFSRMLQFEKRVAADFSMLLSVSSLDLHALETNFQAKRVRLLENGVDVDYFALAPPVKREVRKNLVFVGAMDWLPNSDGVVHFVDAVLPLLKKECPQVQFTVVGKNPPEQIQNLSQIEGVRVTGTVADVRPYLADADVVVVPLRVGGGTRLKILEAFASGRPVISTTLGCEGIECLNGEHLVIADNPADFAASVLRVLRDPDFSGVLTQNARKLVLQKYSWDVICDKLDRFYAEV